MSRLLFFLPPPPPPLLPPSLSLQQPILSLSFSSSSSLLSLNKTTTIPFPLRRRRRRDFRMFSDDGDDGGGGDGGDGDVGVEADGEEMEEDETEEFERDYDVEYETLLAGGDDSIAMVQSKSFVSTQGWNSEVVVDYRINEDEFHKISLMDCDFFIRKPPDPDNNVYDFREMYVTEPDTDIYAIPRVLAPMPEQYMRCAKSDWGTYNVTEPPIDALRDPMYKSEWEVMKVFLTKHHRNRRMDDPDFVLDFEEIYVIDSKTKSITRARVVVTVPEGRERNRKNDLLVIRDNATSFKIIPSEERDDPTTVVHREEWDQDRKDMERHLSKLRDFSVSNWF
ncbi:hypothetical protein OSB04_005483 [Centaurea solstitialis]|uniref:Plastid transcriptionally active 6 n=1 Tax=Centaurea solstitialis TaxID=347529 RepID=A0AA38TG38_9ASTR|nr:hypothetical protein OSB04_005483 [Centaurea solstitialis]